MTQSKLITFRFVLCWSTVRDRIFRFSWRSIRGYRKKRLSWLFDNCFLLCNTSTVSMNQLSTTTSNPQTFYFMKERSSSLILDFRKYAIPKFQKSAWLPRELGPIGTSHLNASNMAIVRQEYPQKLIFSRSEWSSTSSCLEKSHLSRIWVSNRY